ncbi:hypothetical protein [Longimicrobium sp.]|uniref:hypothetical protein n=1 Tax=Longimicrobium sp. TaxID=2029185 RepID=UPI002F945E72
MNGAAPMPMPAFAPPPGRARVAAEGIAAGLWWLFLLFSPVAVFRSGMPQPGDWIAALVVALLVASGLLRRSLRFPAAALRPLRPLMVFVGYTFLITTAWTVWLGRVEMMIFPMFYLFNLCVLAGGLILLAERGAAFLRTTAWLIAVSVWVQALIPLFISLPGHHGGVRATLFFNNPNQLGYYAMLAGCICAVAYNNRLITLRVLLLTLVSAGWLAMLSLSKAAMLSIAALIVFQVVRRPALLVPSLAAVMLGGPVVGARLMELPQVERTLTRFASMGKQDDDSLAGRGYDRIAQKPEYLVLGAAEGAYDRFEAMAEGSELHSALGSLVFCYGIIGTLSLSLFVLRTFWLVSFSDMLVLVPVVFYNATHQGLRFTHLWIFFFFVLGVGTLRAQAAAAAEAPRPGARPARPRMPVPAYRY